MNSYGTPVRGFRPRDMALRLRGAQGRHAVGGLHRQISKARLAILLAGFETFQKKHLIFKNEKSRIVALPAADLKKIYLRTSFRRGERKK